MEAQLSVLQKMFYKLGESVNVNKQGWIDAGVFLWL